MRDCSKNRAGYDRVLMAVAATFLTVSATSALAQSGRPQQRRGTRDRCGDPAPRTRQRAAPDRRRLQTGRHRLGARCGQGQPSPRRLSKTEPSQAAEPKPSRYRDRSRRDAPALRPPQRRPPKPVKAASNVPPADQPVADKLRDMLGAKSLRYFDRKAERAAVEKFYTAREYAPVWTQAGALTAGGKGVIARLKDAAAEGLNAADYPVPDFAAATTPDALAEAELKLTASMLDYARQAQSGRMHWSQVSARHPLSRASDRSHRSAGECHGRQGRIGRARRATTRRTSSTRN